MITRIRPQGNPASAGSPRTPRDGVFHLRKGDVIRGEIVRHHGKGEVEIQSGGQAFRAFTTLRVREGEQYDFRVKVEAGKNSPAVLERVAKNGSRQNLPTLLSEITSALPMRDLSSRTSAILRRLALAIPDNVYQGRTPDPVSWLSRFMTHGGLFWEGKVARSLLRQGRSDWKSRLENDLKGMLLDLRKSLGSEKQRGSEIETVGRKVDEALDLIQTNQMENLDHLREEGCWVLLVPGRSEEGFEGAELHVRRNNKEKEIRFAMLLDFSHLGPVEVAASILDSTIMVRFEVSGEKKAESVRASLPLLEAGLKDAGLLPGPLVCFVRGTDSEGDEARRNEAGISDSINLVI